MAYLSTRTGEVKNTFESGRVVPVITEEFDGTVKKNIQIKNAGNVPAYIRVALIGNWCDANGNVLQSVDVNVTPDGWSRDATSGYYYYDSAENNEAEIQKNIRYDDGDCDDAVFSDERAECDGNRRWRCSYRSQ